MIGAEDTSASKHKSYQSIENWHVNVHSINQIEKDWIWSLKHFQKQSNCSVSRKKLGLLGCALVLASIGTIFVRMPSEMSVEGTNFERPEHLTSLRPKKSAKRKAQRIADHSRNKLLNHPSTQLQPKLSRDANSPNNDLPDTKGTFVNESSSHVVDSENEREMALVEKIKIAPIGCEATFVIIRHCEKGNIQEHCTYVGYERSVFLSTLFGHDAERWPAPTYIYALGPGGRHQTNKLNFREIETVGAISEKLKVPVDDSYSVKDMKKLVENLLESLLSGDLCGKVVLISWKHSEIAKLAHHFGCGPAQGCLLHYAGKSYDEVWQIKYVYRNFAHSSKKNLELFQTSQWKVFGSVQSENFDPLAFSKKVGDYSSNRNPRRNFPGWHSEAVEIAERKSPEDSDDWFMANEIDFLASVVIRSRETQNSPPPP